MSPVQIKMACIRMARATRSSVFEWYKTPLIDMAEWIDAAVKIAKEEKEASNSGR